MAWNTSSAFGNISSSGRVERRCRMAAWFLSHVYVEVEATYGSLNEAKAAIEDNLRQVGIMGI